MTSGKRAKALRRAQRAAPPTAVPTDVSRKVKGDTSLPFQLVGQNAPVLRTECRALSDDECLSDFMRVLAGRLLTTVKRQGAHELVQRGKELHRVKQQGALAIAAPQVGLPFRLVVTCQGVAVANPQFVPLREKIDEGPPTVLSVEGCLSIPGRAYEVRRYKLGTLTGTLVGPATVERIERRVEGLDARMWQHEIDHLHGILIRDIGNEVTSAQAQGGVAL